jgi:hypothetical protein
MSGQAWGYQVRAQPISSRGVNIASAFSRKRAAALLATAGAACFALPGMAQAQGKQIDISVSNRLQYDTDVVLSDKRISGGRGSGDINSSPSLDLDIYLPRATGSFYLRGGLGYVFYRKFTNLNRERINLEGGFDQRVLSDCIVHGGAQYSRQLSDIGDLPSNTPVGNAARNSEERRTLSADIGCGGAVGIRPSVAVSRTEVRNTEPLRKLSDADTNSLTGQIGYSAPAIGIVSVFGRYSDSKYINRSAPNGQEDGVRTYAAGVQIERDLGTRFNFTGSVNLSKVKPYLSSVQDFSGVGYDLSATYSGDLFQLSLSGSRAAQPSTLLFVSYDIQTSLGLSLSTAISSNLTWRGGITFNRRAFAPSPLFIGAPTRGSEDLYVLNASLNYKFNRRLSFSIDGNYSKRTTDSQLFQYDQKRFSLTTTLSL